VVTRNEGPFYNLGFGVYERSQDEMRQDEEVQGPNYQSGPIERALNSDPKMGMLSAFALTIAGAVTAGKVVKKGGTRLLKKMSNSQSPLARQALTEFRAIQAIADDMQGLSRIYADPNDPLKIYDATGRGDQVESIRNFWMSKGEVDQARRLGPNQVASEWGIKDEIRSRVVAQARRLPYELPAAYVTQRAIADPLLGTGQDRDINWFNPVDVTTDFVNQSMKNLLFMLGPFEAGTGAAAHTYRKMMTQGVDSISTPFSGLASGFRSSNAGVVLQASLDQIGHDAGALLSKVTKFSSQSLGALAAGIEEASAKRVGIREFGKNFTSINSQIRAADSKFERALTRLDFTPGPMGGFVSGFRAARDTFRQIGADHDAFQTLFRLGKDSLDSSTYARLKNTGMLSSSPLVGLSRELDEFGSGGLKGFKNSEFYKLRLQDEYGEILKGRLAKKLTQDGMGNTDANNLADDFIRRFNVRVGQDADISRRVAIGTRTQNIEYSNRDDFFSQILARTDRYSQTQRNNLTNALGSAIDEADLRVSTKIGREFNPLRRNIDTKIKQQWNKLYNEEVPSMSNHMVGKRLPDYNSFDMRIGGADHDYLIKQAAKSAGLEKQIADDSIEQAANYLNRIGISADNPDILRGFLVSKKEINKPWQTGGFNVFGFRQVAVQDAVRKGLIDEEPSVRRTLGHLTKSSDERVASTIPGLYETRGGHLIDINQMRRGGRRILDKIASDYKIPIVNFNPLELAGYGRSQGMFDTNMLHYASGRGSVQPFVQNASNVDFMLMLRRGGRASKGEVRAFGGVKGLETRSLGIFQPTSATSMGLAGTHARIASGDMGYGPLESTPQQKGRLASIFLKNNSKVQQGSIGGLARRIRNRKRDINNPVTMAKLLRGDTVSDARGTYRMVDGEVRQIVNGRPMGQPVVTADKVADSLDVFHKFVNRNVFPKALYKQAPDGDEASKAALARIRSMFTGSAADASVARRAILEEKTVNGQVAFLKTVQQEEKALVARLRAQGRAKEAAELEIAQKTLIGRHLKGSSSPGFFERPTSQAKQAMGQGRRIDETISDFQSYMAIRSGVVGRGQQFASVVEEFLKDIDQLKKSGVLSPQEAVEARAAMLSTQMHYAKISNFSAKEATVNTARQVVDAIGDSSGTLGPLRQALGDIAEGYTGNTHRSAFTLRAKGTGVFGTADELYEGGVYNPFGNTQTVFTPTFGQAVNQVGLGRALGSALGFGTYRNPQAFSAAASMTSHFVNRLNRYASVFGGALDPTAFRGPVDMFARGMVGQRVLPLYAAGATALGVDATIGGMLNDRDAEGNRVYAPYFLSRIARPFAEAQALTAGLVPGGLDYEEAREQIFEGEVAVRRNRYWPLGRTPFKGQGVEYFRPSWFRRLQSAPQYAESGYDNPVERLAFGYDFSPLRPFDPYRFEREHYLDRPYPVTGDYFTGPFGPVTPLLNATVGRILKPKRSMHEEEVAAAMGSYMPVGQSGAVSTMAYGNSMRSDFESVSSTIGGDIAGLSQQRFIQAQNAPAYTGFDMAARDIAVSNYMLAAQAYGSNIQGMQGSAASAYGVPTLPGIMPPTIIPSRAPVTEAGFQQVAGDVAYRTQEMLGIYGFGFGAVRSGLGFGDQDYTPTAPVLQSADSAYGFGRSFWDLSLGGLGDMPSETVNLNISEVVRRFVPKSRSGINYINPIRNTMGVQHSFLPGAEYFTDFTRGDPFAAIKEGEVRLPGEVYARLNTLYSDESGKYGVTDRHKILGNVAPYSRQYRELDSQINSMDLSPAEQLRVDQTRMQVSRITKRNEFFEYTTMYDPNASIGDKLIERALHMDNVVTRKLGRRSSAVEDWERNNVYGPTFQQWQHPVQSFIEPMIYENTQRNPFEAAGRLGFGFQFFGKTPQAKAISSTIGSVTGFTSGLFGQAYETITGRRFVPKKRKEQARLEEYTDILTYVKNMHLSNQAKQAGDMFAAQQFDKAAKRTMYGIDLASASIQDIVATIPKRKREHFEAFLTANEKERERILSTAPRLERRMLQAAYGMQVEKLPSLQEFFSKNELPGQNWEGWHPNTNMDNIKIKIGQNQGLDLSQMGYYPQQIQQANLVNPSFPVMGFVEDSRSIKIKLDAMLRGFGINGTVTESPNPFGQNSLSLSQGVFV
jgi:hypothetical protein